MKLVQYYEKVTKGCYYDTVQYPCRLHPIMPRLLQYIFLSTILIPGRGIWAGNCQQNNPSLTSENSTQLVLAHDFLVRNKRLGHRSIDGACQQRKHLIVPLTIGSATGIPGNVLRFHRSPSAGKVQVTRHYHSEY